MGYLFDRATRISQDDGLKTKVAEKHAVYVITDQARHAATEIFKGMESEQLVRFLFLPFPQTCIEWRDGDEQVCVVLEDTWAKDTASGIDAPAVNVAVLVESKNGRQYQASLYYVRTTTSDGAIPWYEAPAHKEIPRDMRMSDELNRAALTQILVLLALLNAPNLRIGERVDQVKLNKARAKSGKPALSPYTTIRPTMETRDWVQAQKHVDRSPAKQHWVKGHLHTYWTGPRTDEQKPVIKLLAPHKRGNPERGEKPQRYVVT